MSSCVACELCSARHLPIYLSVCLSTAGSPPQPQPQVAGVAAAGVAAGGAEAPPLGREASVESAPPTYLASIVALRRREGDDVVAQSSSLRANMISTTGVEDTSANSMFSKFTTQVKVFKTLWRADRMDYIQNDEDLSDVKPVYQELRLTTTASHCESQLLRSMKLLSCIPTDTTLGPAMWDTVQDLIEDVVSAPVENKLKVRRVQIC